MNDRRPSKPPPPPGSRTPSVLGPGARFGKFEIVKRLALGTMTEIFAARVATLPRFQKTVVVKRLLPQLAVRPGYAEHFHEEAVLAAILHHPNLVEVYDVGVADGNHFISMELVEGETLEAISNKLRTRNRPLPLEHALHVVIGLCAGLHYAHEKNDLDGKPLGLVHRDVTPANVMLTYEGVVKLLDFGSAHCDDEVDTGVARTGSVHYMSPEQCTGADVDGRADVFSLGVLLYELTVGRRLYSGRSDYDVMKQIVEQAVVPPRTADAKFDVALERIVMRALEKRPEVRFPSASALGDALEVFVRARKMHVSTAAAKQFIGKLFAESDDGWDLQAAPAEAEKEAAPSEPSDPWLPAPIAPAPPIVAAIVAPSPQVEVPKPALAAPSPKPEIANPVAAKPIVAKPAPATSAVPSPTLKPTPKKEDQLAESWLALDAATEAPPPTSVAPAATRKSTPTAAPRVEPMPENPILAPKLTPLAGRPRLPGIEPSKKIELGPTSKKEPTPLTDFLDGGGPKIIDAQIAAPSAVSALVTGATVPQTTAALMQDLKDAPGWSSSPELPPPALEEEEQPFPDLPAIAVPAPAAVIAARPIPSPWPGRIAIFMLAALPVAAAAVVVVAVTRHPVTTTVDSPTVSAPIVATAPVHPPDPPPVVIAPPAQPATKVIVRQRAMNLVVEKENPPARPPVEVAVKPAVLRVGSDGNPPNRPIAPRVVDATPKPKPSASPPPEKLSPNAKTEPHVAPPKKSLVLTPAPAAVELPTPPPAEPPARLDGEGTLAVASNPPVMVAVDGAWKGPTPVKLKVPAGKHILFLSNPAIQLRKTVPVTVQPDQTLDKKFDFSQPAPVAPASPIE
jgi:serine/threonine protein kinase